MFFFSVGDPTLFWLVLSLIWENKSLSSLQRTSLFGWRSSFCFSSELHNFGVKYSLQWSEEVSGNIYFTYDPLLQLKCHLVPLGLILHVTYLDFGLPRLDKNSLMAMNKVSIAERRCRTCRICLIKNFFLSQVYV